MTKFNILYNEIDQNACAWLSNLMDAGHIRPGKIDDRDIREITPNEVTQYDTAHFFAGIGGWELAFKIADFKPTGKCWTGSCPCQPFSSAGKGAGFADERHLWPHWNWLIEKCRPATVFGEQVASKDGLGWFDLVSADLEGQGYAVGASDMCAAGFGAPHIRQRLWWVGLADSHAHRCVKGVQSIQGRPSEWTRCDCVDHGMGDTDNTGSQKHREPGDLHLRECDGTDTGRQHVHTGLPIRLADTQRIEWGTLGIPGLREIQGAQGTGSAAEFAGSSGHHLGRADAPDSQWRDADWLYCRDGKWRPVESGTFPLAYGIPARVGRLRGYGNAIVPQIAAEWIKAVMEC